MKIVVNDLPDSPEECLFFSNKGGVDPKCRLDHKKCGLEHKNGFKINCRNLMTNEHVHVSVMR